MSRRAIKRYEQSLAAQRVQGVEEEAAEDSDSDADPASKSEVRSSSNGPMNMFGLLLDDGGDEDPEADEFQQEEEKRIGESFQTATGEGEGKSVDTSSETVPSSSVGGGGDTMGESTGKKKRRRKKKNRKPADDEEDWFVGDVVAQEAAERASTVAADESKIAKDPAFIPDSYFGTDDDEEVKRLAREVMRDVIEIAHPDGVIPGRMEAFVRASQHLISVNPQTLSADNELKHLFGTRVVESERVATEVEEGQQRRRYLGVGGGSRVKRKIHLVQPRDTWWSTAPGFGMVLDEERNEAYRQSEGRVEGNVRYFRYNHERRYDQLQQQFYAIVQSHNPNLFVELINRAPFHVDTLLQLAELHRQTGEFDRAGELVERALYVLEYSWHRAFKPFNGLCRLRSDVKENQSFFLALFRHVQLLSRKGLYRTALESGKLLLNLDPPYDPTGVLLMLDSLALKCGEYGWVRAMRRDYWDSSLNCYPNFVISAAVAAHLQGEHQGGQKESSGAGSKKKKKKRTDCTPFVESESERELTPLQQLTNALLAFPMALQPILSTIEQEGMHLCEEYDLFKPELASSTVDDRGALLRVCRIYALNSKEIWTGSTLQLLRDAAICAGSAAAGGRGSEGYKLAEVGLELRTAAAAFASRTRTFDSIEIAEFSSSTTNVPAELVAAEEPVPGEFADDAGVIAEDNRDWHRRIQAGQDGEAELRDRAPSNSDDAPAPQRPVSTAQAAIAFFQSLLPWYTPPGEAADGSPENAPGQLDPGAWDQLQEVMGRRENDERAHDSDDADN